MKSSVIFFQELFIMSTSLFQAEDWVYVADSMGRLGQGYYKNRSNPSQTITPTEFEQRRSQPQPISSNVKEQNINKTNISTTTSSNGFLSSSQAEGTNLTPWDNPIIGEQAATTPTTKSTPQTKATASAQVNKPEPQKAPEQRQNEGGESGNHGSAYDGSGIGFGNDTDNGNGNGSNGGNAKVICTELVRQGFMRESERRACTIYALSRLPSSFMVGYHFWAVPYVQLMRKSKLASQIMIPLVTWRTHEVCHRLGLRKTGSLPGKILCALHDPLCSLIAFFVQKTDYTTLYKQEISS
jgi:hypothetical protein